jgi:2-polyprenyl-3-methyl-5-hydroxy-6-metoxy-1,4-benzoquinol methylase
MTAGQTQLRSRADKVRAALYRFYFRAEKRIAPTLRSSQYAYYEALRSQLTTTSRWLDMGCGHQVFGDWMSREQDTVLRTSALAAGVDLDWEGLRKHQGIRHRVFGDLARLPFQPGAWDVITANMVMEHLPDPTVVLREVHHALVPGGTFVFHTPNFYHWGTLAAVSLPSGLKKRLIRFFEDRVEADVFDTHYRINTAAAVRQFAEECGFDVVDIAHVSSSATLKMLGPIVLLELTYLRLIEHPSLAQLRSALVVTLRKRASAAPAS